MRHDGAELISNFGRFELIIPQTTSYRFLLLEIVELICNTKFDDLRFVRISTLWFT